MPPWPSRRRTRAWQVASSFQLHPPAFTVSTRRRHVNASRPSSHGLSVQIGFNAHDIEQTATMAAAICRYGYQRLRRFRGADTRKLTMSPPLDVSLVKGHGPTEASSRGYTWQVVHPA
jgi:hypothetical protein